MKYFAFFYFMKDQPEDITKTAPLHTKYWESLQLEGYKGGAFSDRSGGMIIFKATSKSDAEELVNDDPFLKEHLLHTRYLKEWNVE